MYNEYTIYYYNLLYINNYYSYLALFLKKLNDIRLYKIITELISS